MSAALKPLSDRIEAGIRKRTEERVDAALAAARGAAFRAYSDALASVCGLPFAVTVADVMSGAEETLRVAAIAAGEGIETAAVLKQLQSAIESEGKSTACRAQS